MKKLLDPENRILLIAAIAVLLSLIIAATVIIIAANGGFQGALQDSGTGNPTYNGGSWSDPDNPNWTDPIM